MDWDTANTMTGKVYFPSTMRENRDPEIRQESRGYSIYAGVDPDEPKLAGPFDTLDIAKAAYVVMVDIRPESLYDYAQMVHLGE